MQQRKNASLSAAIVAALSMCSSAALLAQGLPNSLPPQPLVDALEAFARHTPLQLVYSADVAKGVMSPGARAGQTDEDTLRELLRDTGLTFEFVNERTVTVTPARSEAAKQVPPGSLETRASVATQEGYGLRLARMETEDSASAQADGEHSGADGTDDPQSIRLEEVLVTGSHICGTEPVSRLISVDAMQIRQEGFTDLGEVIRSIPQNFSGGMNPGVSGGAGDQGSLSGGSGLNLRGLGADASLTLLNGRRMAYEGWGQGIDISAIPVAAVDRIEILPDGASAIYGSDAVAGV